jgi:hypothetical protein
MPLFFLGVGEEKQTKVCHVHMAIEFLKNKFSCNETEVHLYKVRG